MQTSTVNPVAALLNAAPAAKPASAAPAVPFQQVLNREVSERQPQPEPQRSAAQNEEVREPVKQNTAPQANAKNESKAPKNTVKSGEKSADAPKEEETETAPADQASNDLLALVANLNQAAVPAEAQAKDAGQTVATDAAIPQAAVAANLAAPALKAGEKADGLSAIDGAAEKGRSKGLAIGAETAQARAPGKDAADPSLAAADPAIAAGATETKPQARTALDMALARNGAEAKGDAALNFDTQSAKAQDALQVLASKAAAEKAPALPELGMAPLQQAAALAQAGGAADKLSPRVGTPAWDNALGQKIVWMVGGAEQTASLSLNPPDLGPLQVVLNVTNDQADATFIAAQPEVRQAIEAAMPKLREMMGEAGIQLGQANVSAQAQGQQQASGEPQRQPQQRGGSGTSQAEAPAVAVRSQHVSSGLGVVDTFA